MTGLRDLAQIAAYGVGLGTTTMAALHFGTLFTEFRGRMTDEATLATYRHFPHYANTYTDWEAAYRMLPYFAVGGAAFTVVVTIFVIGLTEVVA